ncbi:Arabinose operon regulatory protein, partial [termite gut metagenome]
MKSVVNNRSSKMEGLGVINCIGNDYVFW